MAIEITQATEEQLSDIRQALGIATTKEIFPEAKFTFGIDNISIARQADIGTIVNFKPLSLCSTITLPYANSGTATSLSATINANYLNSLEDIGTQIALVLNGYGFTTESLNQLFTDLPATTKTATINVTNNPGTATCDPTIATAKGYTIVTE